MNNPVMCIVQQRAQAESNVTQLRAAGFAREDISILFPQSNPSNQANSSTTNAPTGALAGAGAGGVMGGALGVLAGIGAIAIPGLGPFIAAGPLLAALGGVAAGATVGSVTGALIGMGIPESEAKRYESQLKGGNILISVHAENSDDRKRAATILRTSRAQDISTPDEASISTSREARF